LRSADRRTNSLEVVGSAEHRAIAEEIRSRLNKKLAKP
jgi:hypothetical protein